MLARYRWTSVMALFSLAILICFAGAIAGGLSFAIWLLPLSGLFMFFSEGAGFCVVFCLRAIHSMGSTEDAAKSVCRTNPIIIQNGKVESKGTKNKGSAK